MKISEVPDAAYDAKATKIPQKKIVVPDWEALYEQLLANGYIVIDCPEDQLRVSARGSEESPSVKAFNCWARTAHKKCIRTRRIGKTRWYVTL